eukprot:3430699-Amphidinium_carterae.1
MEKQRSLFPTSVCIDAHPAAHIIVNVLVWGPLGASAFVNHPYYDNDQSYTDLKQITFQTIVC